LMVHQYRFQCRRFRLTYLHRGSVLFKILASFSFQPTNFDSLLLSIAAVQPSSSPQVRFTPFGKFTSSLTQ
jgi:hypothetical protein